MDQRLIDVAKAGDINSLYAILRGNQYSLDIIDKVPFVDTPLHYAVVGDETRFAMEVARLKPSFTRKQNQDGFSPMNLASKNGHVVMVKKLLAFDSDLLFIRGREWNTPLHCAAIEGKVEVIKVLLSLDASPKFIIEDLTVGGETALHLAAKNGQLEACSVLLEWLKQLNKRGLQKWKDDNDKTALDVAGSPEVVEFLASEYNVYVAETNVMNAKHFDEVVSNATNTVLVDEVETNATNTNLVAAMEITVPIINHVDEEEINSPYTNKQVRSREEGTFLGSLFRMVIWLLFLPFLLVGRLLRWIARLLNLNGILRQLLKPFDTFCKGSIGENMEMRNALLVVGVLIATIMFQAGLSPPGGVWQENFSPEIRTLTNPSNNANIPIEDRKAHYAGKAVMGDQFHDFAIGNSIGFYASIILICIVTVGFPLQPLIIVTLWSMSSTYIQAISIISPHTITLGFFPQVFMLLCVAYILIPRIWG